MCLYVLLLMFGLPLLSYTCNDLIQHMSMSCADGHWHVKKRSLLSNDGYEQ